MSQTECSDVITGVTPLERWLWQTHPRLYFTGESIEELKGKIAQDPWRRMFERVAEEGGALAVGGSQVLSLKDEAKTLLQETLRLNENLSVSCHITFIVLLNWEDEF